MKIISPYKELQKELEELKLLFATRSMVKKKSLLRKSNKRSFSLDEDIVPDLKMYEDRSLSRNSNRRSLSLDDITIEYSVPNLKLREDKSVLHKSNTRTYSLDSVPNQNYSCTCTCVSNKNDSSFSTLQNSLLESFTRDTACDTLSYSTNISPTNSNSVYIVI